MYRWKNKEITHFFHKTSEEARIQMLRVQAMKQIDTFYAYYDLKVVLTHLFSMHTLSTNGLRMNGTNVLRWVKMDAG